MFIKCKDELTIADVNSNIYLPKIYFSHTTLVRMINGIEEKNTEVQNLLNQINFQGIFNLSLGSRTYERNGERLGFDDLSSAERLFLAAYAADHTKTKIIVTGEVGELTKNTLCIFFKEFGLSEYVNVSSPDGWFKDYYLKIREEVC